MPIGSLTRGDVIFEPLQSRRPEPRIPLFKSGKPDLAENVERLLDGFGEA